MWGKKDGYKDGKEDATKGKDRDYRNTGKGQLLHWQFERDANTYRDKYDKGYDQGKRESKSGSGK